MTSAPSFARTTLRQAVKEGRDWPDLSGGEDGTVVHFSADNDDADMTVTSSADEGRLLAAVRAAAITAGMPKTDFLTRHGTMTASVDAEFNDYLARSGRDTRFSFPFRRLLAALRAAKLPNPLVVAVEKEGRSATLVGAGGRTELTKDRTLFTAQELAEYDVLETHFHVEWWAPVAAWAFMLFFLGVFALAPAIMIRFLRKKPFIGPPPPPPTPEQVQAAYDARTKVSRWRQILVGSPALIVFPFILLMSNKPVMAQATAAMPRWFKDGMASPWLFMGVVGLMLPLFLAQAIRNRNARQPSAEPNPLSGIWPMFVGMLFMIGLLTAVRVKPDLFRSVAPEYRRLLIFSVPALMIGLSVFLMWRNARGEKRDLPEGDSVSVMARELGGQAGVRVRRVVERKHGGPNAFATLFGTVGVTAKLRETLDEDETHAVMAHEIGHLKASDPWRFLLLSLGLLGALLGVSWWVRFNTKLGDSPVYQVADQMFFIVGLPFFTAWAFSPRRRKAEHAADLFALEQTGDVELVARALTKIHDANLAPHRLHPRDERLASHPALEKRLARLREAATPHPNPSPSEGRGAY